MMNMPFMPGLSVHALLGVCSCLSPFYIAVVIILGKTVADNTIAASRNNENPLNPEIAGEG